MVSISHGPRVVHVLIGDCRIGSGSLDRQGVRQLRPVAGICPDDTGVWHDIDSFKRPAKDVNATTVCRTG